jgi:hypothetical protein
MKKGEIISVDNLYSAIPYQKEIDQITSREYFDKEYELNKDLVKDSPLTKNDVI